MMNTRYIALATFFATAACSPAHAQKPLTATLLKQLPKSVYCTDTTDQVAAAAFRVHDRVNARFRAGDTFWVWIVCPDNFGRSFWRGQSV